MLDQRPDFVKVQLTPFGVKLAGSSPLRISNGRRSLEFTAGVPVEIERSYEWNGWLKGHAHVGGETVFEIVPDGSPAASE